MNVRDRRALVAGAGCIALVLGMRGVPAAVRWLSDLRTEVEVDRRRVHQLTDDAQHAVCWVNARDSARRASAVVDARLLPASARLARAELAHHLDQLSSELSVRVERIETLDDSMVEAGLRRVSVHAALTTDTEGLLDWLGAVADDSVLMRPDSVWITPQNATSPATVPEVVRADVLVRGWSPARSTER